VAAKQGSRAFAGALARSWSSPLPVDLWRWQVAGLRREAARRLLSGEIDVCVADFLSAMPNLPHGLRRPIVLFEHNVEHVLWRRLARTGPFWRRPLLELEWRKLRRYEAAACGRAQLTIAVSAGDADALSRLAPAARVRAVPTGVDTAYIRPNGVPKLATGLVFTGSMDWYPNEDAILYFLRTSFPRIRAEAPDVSLTIVGRNPSPALRAAAGPGIRVTGTVDDVRPFVDEAAVYVVPLRVGGGTRLKLFEALAMGKAVVSTTVGAEGLPLEPGEHFVQADAPEDFARAVVGLLRRPDERRRLGEAGRQLVESRYSWPQVAMEFEQRCMEVIS
jgi:glycosyltransferase involved in cell wall biosynthesis